MAKAPPKNKTFQKLITMGKEKGFLTYEEINETLPEDIVDSRDLDVVMAMIEENEIAIVENEKEFKKAKKAAGKAAGSEEEVTRGLDPVRLYLKKMGSVALLTREGEIDHYSSSAWHITIRPCIYNRVAIYIKCCIFACGVEVAI